MSHGIYGEPKGNSVDVERRKEQENITLNGSQMAIKRSKLIAVIVSEEILVAQLSMY